MSVETKIQGQLSMLNHNKEETQIIKANKGQNVNH